MNSIPEGKRRDEALKRIETLDCGNPDKTLASCDPAAAPPPEVLVWQKELEAASVDDAAYCKSPRHGVAGPRLRKRRQRDSNFAWHNPYRDRLAETGREAPALVDFIMSKDCPVSASLTDEDKAKLLKIKQDAEKKFPPPPASKKEK